MAKKPMRQSYRPPAPSSKALGKRRAAEEWEGTSDGEGVISLDSSDDDEPKPVRKKARSKAPPASKPPPAAAGETDPHAFLTSILHQHSALSKNLSDATTDNTKLTGENQKLAKDLAKA
eukprot:1797887-Prymnesium_polylepis.1